jgi:hypothetical protein
MFLCDKLDRLSLSATDTINRQGETKGPYSQDFIFFITYNRLECYIILDFEGLLETNTLAYCAHLKVRKNMKCCEHDVC